MSDLIGADESSFTSSPYCHLGADEYVTDCTSCPHLLTCARAAYGSNATAKDASYGFVKPGRLPPIWRSGAKRLT
jgi:hexosaminidase